MCWDRLNRRVCSLPKGAKHKNFWTLADWTTIAGLNPWSLLQGKPPQCPGLPVYGPNSLHSNQNSEIRNSSIKDHVVRHHVGARYGLREEDGMLVLEDFDKPWAGLDLNFRGHLSRQTSEIENSPVLHEMTPVRTIIYVIIFLIIDLSCQTSVIIIQPVRRAIFQKFYLSGTVGQSLRSSPAWVKQAVKSGLRQVLSDNRTIFPSYARKSIFVFTCQGPNKVSWLRPEIIHCWGHKIIDRHGIYRTEIQDRLDLLKNIWYVVRYYEWQGILQFYATIINQIEIEFGFLRGACTGSITLCSHKPQAQALTVSGLEANFWGQLKSGMTHGHSWQYIGLGSVGLVLSPAGAQWWCSTFVPNVISKRRKNSHTLKTWVLPLPSLFHVPNGFAYSVGWWPLKMFLSSFAIGCSKRWCDSSI